MAEINLQTTQRIVVIVTGVLVSGVILFFLAERGSLALHQYQVASAQGAADAAYASCLENWKTISNPELDRYDLDSAKEEVCYERAYRK